jgi:signal transduction histidine kinase/ligand-binding sensor domain-containing protein/DNA-binding response OmpR family regulator
MSKYFKILFLISYYFRCFPITLCSQTWDTKFDHISIEDGLSQSLVQSIFQDTKGFIWFGTQDGLNRFDGYHFKIYRYDPKDSNSISDNNIMAIHESISPRYENFRVLWIGTRVGGLNKFDPITEKWTHYQNKPGNPNSLSHNAVYSIFEDKPGILWIGTGGGGLNRFNPFLEKWTCYSNESVKAKPLINNIVLSIHEDIMPDHTDRRMLWLGGLGGIYKFDRDTEELTNYYFPDPVQVITEDETGRLWLGTQEGEVHQFDKKTEQFIYNRNNSTNPDRLASHFVRAILKDKSGKFWIGTDVGLYKLNGNILKKEYLTLYQNEPGNPNSLYDQDIYSLYEDKSNVLWIGTSRGISKLDLKKKKFRQYRHEPGDPNSLSYNVVGSICEDQNGVLWISSWDSGLNKFDRQQNKWTLYHEKPGTSNSLSRNKINDIYEDRRGILWIGTILGLDKFDPQLNSFKNFKKGLNSQKSLLINNVTSIYQDKSGLLWIGCLTGILTLFDPQTETFKHFKNDPGNPYSFPGCRDIYSIYEDKIGTLWFGTESGGIAVLKPKDREEAKFINFKSESHNPYSLAHNTVYSFHEDSRGIIWIGTKGGLSRLNPENLEDPKFKNYRVDDGLPNDVIYGILEDDDGNLWMGTNNGLSKFNPETETFRNYDVADGLQSNEFTRDSYCKTFNGEFIFGGINGFNIFYPDSIIDNPYIPSIVLTDFQIFNKSVVLTNNSALNQSISETKQITLSYDQEVFSFEFAALDFTAPEKNRYAYKMEGIDPDWVITSAKRRFATYTKLAPGEYLFRVKGSNNDGVWNEQGTSVRIIITPPWWRTAWAYILYGVIFLSIIVSIWRFQLRRIRMKHELEMQRFESQKLHEIDSMKSRFFVNISHEFRTPLTLILGPINKILTKTRNQEIKQELNMMQRNARRLQRLINQLLDLSKIEAGKMTLQARPENIVALLNRIVQSFESRAKLKGIELKFSSELDEIIAYIDRDKIENIFYNLLSNALKFTPERGTVAVNLNIPPGPLRQKDGAPSASKGGIGGEFPPLKGDKGGCPSAGYIEITISDTGIGIPQDRLDKIFDRFYQVDDSYTREHEGTGIGLALTKELVELHHGKIVVKSELNKGTTFTVYLPLGKEHLKPEEIVSEIPSEEFKLEIFQEEPSEGLEPSECYAPPSRRRALPLVLIVEDNRDMRIYMQDCLASNYRVIEAVDGEDGLHRAIEKIPDLIISDVMMPKMDGFEMCGRLKSDERTSHIPVILLTARASDESKIKGLELGADDYLIKPFDRTELLVRAKNLIEQRRKLRERFSRDISLQPKEIAVTSYDEKFLQRTMDIIERHLTDSEFTVDSLLKEVGLSRMQLHRKLRALINCSASEFIRVLRLKRAAQLLQQKSGNVTEIAFEVGFNNLSYFSRCFRQQFGKLPSEYTPMKN